MVVVIAVVVVIMSSVGALVSVVVVVGGGVTVSTGVVEPGALAPTVSTVGVVVVVVVVAFLGFFVRGLTRDSLNVIKLLRRFFFSNEWIIFRRDRCLLCTEGGRWPIRITGPRKVP